MNGTEPTISCDDAADSGESGKKTLGPGSATCPFCLEAIKVHARRCKHCSVDLTKSIEASKEGEAQGRVVYILDRDLVRFAKWSLSLLGLFAVAGVYLLGIDLKRTVQDIDKLRREIEADGTSVANQAANVTAAEEAILTQVQSVQAKHSDIESFAVLAKQSLDLILETQGKVLVAAETLSIARDGTATVRSNLAAVDLKTLNRRPHKLWEIGATLNVHFLGGTPSEHQVIKEAAREWSQHANINFAFSESRSTQIRIAFQQGNGSWSYVGTDSLDFSSEDEPTMNFGWSVLEDRDTVLHNLGHALGLLHEHQNPTSNLVWDEEAVYQQMTGPPNRFTRDATYRNIIRKHLPGDYALPKPFDVDSIMMYSFGPALLKGPFKDGISPRPGLSQMDVQYIGQLYPENS